MACKCKFLHGLVVDTDPRGHLQHIRLTPSLITPTLLNIHPNIIKDAHMRAMGP